MNLTEVKDRLSKVKFVVTDFDGIHTDGYVYTDQDGREMVRCSRKDGLGINMMKKAGIEVCVISKETNPVVTARCKKLGIPVYQSVHTGEGKLEILKRLTEEKGLLPAQVLYLGDDINDLPCLEWAGVAATVADAHPLVMQVALIVTDACGGKHAIRELSEYILAAKGVPLAV